MNKTKGSEAKSGSRKRKSSEAKVASVASEAKSFLALDGAHHSELMRRAEHLYKEAAEKRSKSSVKQTWTKTVLESGTISDRVAALVLNVQEDPVHNIRGLNALIEMSEKKNARQVITVLENLMHLWIGTLLPDRKLVSFEANANKVAKPSSQNLIDWYFENELKNLYARFVSTLVRCSQDSLEAVKLKSLSVTKELLVTKPEQEQALLSLLANKLGDPSKKIASQAVFLLESVLKAHPVMKSVTISEVERLIFRPNTPKKFIYYSLIFLNQILLARSEAELANKLLGIYISLFTDLSSTTTTTTTINDKKAKKGKSLSRDSDDPMFDKILNALLTGMSRAFPFSALPVSTFDHHVHELFKLSHTSCFHTSVRALNFLYAVLSKSFEEEKKKKDVNEGGAAAGGSIDDSIKLFASKAVAKSRKKAAKEEAKKQSSSTPDSSTSTSNLESFRSRLLSVVYERILSLATELSTFGAAGGGGSKTTMFFDLLYRLMTSAEENELSIVLAYVKRLLSVCFMLSPPIVCSILILISEVCKKNPFVSSILEGFNSIPISETTTTTTTTNCNSNDEFKRSEYSPFVRNPRFALADKSCWWEIATLSLCHSHPTVRVFARTIRDGKSISYDGNPMIDLATVNFLDRFVLRNPKKKVSMGKLRDHLDASQRYMENRLPQMTNLSVASASKKPEDEFFLKFFEEREKRKDNASKRLKKKESKKGKKGTDSMGDDFGDDDMDQDAITAELMKDVVNQFNDNHDDDNDEGGNDARNGGGDFDDGFADFGDGGEQLPSAFAASEEYENAIKDGEEKWLKGDRKKKRPRSLVKDSSSGSKSSKHKHKKKRH